ncbi:MAG: glycosyltransferase [Marinibacterium sp.]
MPAPLSIVIPTLDAADDLPRCLESLFEGLHAGLIREVVISDGGSGDGTRAIAESAGAVWIAGPASRGGQIRRGVSMVKGSWILILHADTVLTAGWTQAVGTHIETGGGPAHFRLAFRARGVMPACVAGWGNLRARVFALPYGDQGLLVSRHDYDRAGGCPDQPLMEDVALVRALGRPLVALDVVAATGAERYIKHGWMRRGAGNLSRLARYLLGADPAKLAKDYDAGERPSSLNCRR